ncbi:MAG: SpoIIE family protein phosphatase, partial [Bacteroidia bacterium]|nr:SpoIIE family protein phosphatase [Bacteroidia bacterium]
TFNFIGITHKQTKKVKYQYKLEGLDENWSALTNRTEAPYGNLPQGTYTFKVKAINSLGYKSNEFNYTFTIRPPWWQTWWFRTVCAFVLLLLVYLIFRWRTAALRKDKEKLEQTVKLRTSEVVHQKEVIEVKHKEITDSIHYAERIQFGLLASKKLLDENLNDYFILFKPKAGVSGDFYWATKLSNNNFVIVTADSTGHGVPGAIMSILNIACLKETLMQGIISPDLFLNETRRLIIENLKNDGSAEGGKDGMDGSLLSFDFTTNIMTCASANNPILIIRGNELIEIKGDRMPIGKHEKDQSPFSLKTFNLIKGDLVYTTSDGFADQFGGASGKKFKYKQLQELLLSISKEPMQVQKQKLNDIFDSWKGNLEQIDDVCLIGIRI